ncbi:hypothetical protein M433DRAFT_331942 [Acidomyces richmondensis BFW]|nr:MAG: hypothetical protein FE78DRAFT_513021 [Acidomyces sp. 'richmondensis']KYG49242.1 hypothetical protein M433DRAFT_331942 [Acidomyces richmondensis BFW]
MAPHQQQRSHTHLLTSPRSPLTAISLSNLLLHPTAWHSLPLDIRVHLCSLLPPITPQSTDDDVPTQHDPDTNPLLGPLAGPVKEEVERWQENLRLGFEGRRWRAEAMRAAKTRGEGGFDGFVRWERGWIWGLRDGEAEGEGVGEEDEGDAQAGMVGMGGQGIEDEGNSCKRIRSGDAVADEKADLSNQGVMTDGDEISGVLKTNEETIVQESGDENPMQIKFSYARDGVSEELGSCVQDGLNNVGSPW